MTEGATDELAGRPAHPGAGRPSRSERVGARAGRPGNGPPIGFLPWLALAIAMAAAATLILYLNRGTTFFLDELVHVYRSPTLDLTYVLEPVNGHLGITSKLLYKAVLETIGAEYVVFRILHVLAELVAAGLFYLLVKRRIGALPALAPTVVLLFLGAAYSHVVIPVGFAIFACIAASLGALLALERGDRRGDIAACLLILFAIATFTIGLAFGVGIAISVLIREDRWRRAWIFAVPGSLYAAWWVWSQTRPGSSGDETMLSNVFEIPVWMFNSLSAVTNAIAGLDHRTPGAWLFGELGWGRVFAVVVLAALALRLRRGNVPRTLWVALGILAGYWCLGAMASEVNLRGPQSPRYMYPGTVMVFLVAAEAARGVRFSRLGLAALFAITGLALIGSVSKLSDGATGFREYSAQTRAQFTAIELTRDVIAPSFSTEFESATAAPVGARADEYLRAADRYGGLGFTPSELEAQTPEAREIADLLIVKALELRLVPGKGAPRHACEVVRPAAAGDPITIELPPGAAAIRARSGDPAPVEAGRFGDSPTVFIGELTPKGWSKLRIPADRSRLPWSIEVADASSVRVCRST